MSNLEAPSNATVGDTISVSATITNPTSQQLTQPVDFRLAGTVVQRQNVTLDADQSTTVTFEVPTTGVAPGTYPHGVYARNFGQIATITVEAGENATTTTATTQAGTTTSAETTSAGTTTVASQTTTAENATQAETTTAGAATTQAETMTSAGNETTQAGNETTQAGTATSAGTDTTNASVVASVLDAFGDLV